MGSSEEKIKLLRGNCLTERRKIEQELIVKIKCYNGIIDKLKHNFCRDRLFHHRRKQFVVRTMRIPWLLRQGTLITFSIYFYLYKIMIPTITYAKN